MHVDRDERAQADELKRIYGFWPECGELFRLSDADLFTKVPPPSTPFDDAARAQQKVDDATARFDDKEAEIRAEAQARGQELARRRVGKLARRFTKRKLDPHDVKAIFNPVEFVAFRGLSRKEVSSIEFIAAEARTAELDLAHESLDRAIEAGNVEWKVYRLDANGHVVVEG